MGGFLGKVAVGMFAVVLLVTMSVAALLCKLLALLSAGGLMSIRTREGLSVCLVQMSWRLTLLLSPWIRVAKMPGYADQMKSFQATRAASQRGSKPPPTFIMANHMSFLDTILAVAMLPTSVIFNARCYMGQHLFKLPVLATVCHACGHFPVHFAGSADGDFRVDREKMALVQQGVERHLEGGKGVLCIFPEGQMNKNPGELMPFRYGGMKNALAADAHLAAFTTHGNHLVWPRKAAIGGRPGRISMMFREVAPRGCNALVVELREADPAGTKGKEDYQILADHCRAVMQSDYNAMEAQVGATEAGDGSSKKDD